jgi:hypothetical protein
MLAVAWLLIPRSRAVAPRREQLRWQSLRRIEEEGQRLRAAHIQAHAMPLTIDRSRTIWQTDREILRWVARSEADLKRFPEIAYIFRFQDRQSTMLGELDARLESLTRMRRLCRLSESLRLPI